MARTDNRSDVERLKILLANAWTQILEGFPAEKVYAFGINTNECGQYMYPFLRGENGRSEIASKNVYEFDGRPDIYRLTQTAFVREAHYRLTAGCTALKELDAEGIFGTGAQREGITLYIEGGDVNREWILKWAKKLNPPAVFDRFAKIGAPVDTTGTFTEFGTKKVYETKGYAQSADRRLVAAATQYQLVVFDTTGPKQLFAKALPSREGYSSLGGVGMSGDGRLIGVIPFGGGPHSKRFFIVSGEGAEVRTVQLKEMPSAIAVGPVGDWLAVTDDSGSLNVFKPDGEPIASQVGHAYWPRGIAVSPNGKLVATGDSRSVILWNTSDWSRVWTVEMPVDCLSFDPTGQFLVGSCRYGPRGVEPNSAAILEVKTGKVLREVVVEGYRIAHARFSPDGRHFACAMRIDCEGYSGTNESALIEVETGHVVDRLKADFEQVRDFAFLPHRNEIAVAVFGHTRRPLVLWKPNLSGRPDRSGIG
jgi:hypothetical protein